jgi:tetratricopeptide (TPR) repeat protein
MSDSRWNRVLVLHSYPPIPCLYTFEKGLRVLGYDVVSVGPDTTYGDRTQFAELEPDCHYLGVEPDAHLNDIFDHIGGVPDWVFYLRPAAAFLPRGLLECPVPTVAWLEDDFKFADLDHSLSAYFDLAPTAYWEIEEAFAAHGLEHRPCFNYFSASWLSPSKTFAERVVDVAFVGHLDPHVSRARTLELEKLRRLAREGIRVFVHAGFFLMRMMEIYAQSKIVFQHSGQGEPNLTYRVGEAMTAGAMVLCRRPVRVAGLAKPFVEGKHIVYYDTFDEARDIIRYYCAHDDERREIAENGRRYVQEEFPWYERIGQFVDAHVRTIPPDFLERRHQRLRRLGVDARREKLDSARYFLYGTGRGDIARKLLEEIPGWRDDVAVRASHAVASLFTNDGQSFADDTNAALQANPKHLLAAYNYASALFIQRTTVGLHQVAQLTQQMIDLLATTHPDELDADAVEGFYIPVEMRRFRLEIAKAFLDFPSGPERWQRLRALYLYQLHKNLGTLYLESGRKREAIAAFTKALDVLPDDGYIHALLAKVYAQAGRRHDAVRCYQKAVAYEPQFIEAEVELARLLLEERQYADATAFIESVLLSHLDPDGARLQLYVLLGQSYAAMGNREAARDAFARGLHEAKVGAVDTGVFILTRPSNALNEEHVNRFVQLFEKATRQLGASVAR